MIWLGIPLGLQALCMLVDELHFHRARGLSRWERIGHPLDTLSVLACWALALSVPPGSANLRMYVALACVSCLLVTKDELIHAERCQPLEHWLHALLFILHPIVLSIGAWLWLSNGRALLWLSASVTAAFASYQALYWNVPWTRRACSLSTMPSTTNSVSAGTTPRTTPSPSCAQSRVSRNPWVTERITQLHGTAARVLDVGCGAGFLSNQLARDGFDVTGIDASKASIEVAARHDATGKAQYLHGDALLMPFPDASFDA